jgi:hypothetical protein
MTIDKPVPAQVADQIAVEQWAVEAALGRPSSTGQGNSWRWS